jgi:hypothetical protein
MNGQKERGLFAESLERHVEAEAQILDEYRSLAGMMEDGAISFLIDLILTEEEQHHFLLRSMAKRLREPFKNELSWAVDRDELRRQTQRLREHERKTIDACRQLKSQVPVENVDFFTALLDVMILDSEKHERLLLAVEKLVRA